ncbi:MAG TPA: hypothetical protein VKA08_13665, partial [Balneolales bacterium]|nr:hypothetical protein [Balneolales bacterium]
GVGLGSGGSIRGLSVVGVGMGGDDIQGLNIAGIGIGAGDELSGFSVAGVGIGGTDLKGVNIAAGGIGAENLHNVSLAGLLTLAHETHGIHITGVYFRTDDLEGVATGAVSTVRGYQNGLVIGLYNYARVLHGVQIGILNYARNNPIWARLLPIINLNLK